MVTNNNTNMGVFSNWLAKPSIPFFIPVCFFSDIELCAKSDGNSPRKSGEKAEERVASPGLLVHLPEIHKAVERWCMHHSDDSYMVVIQ